MIADDVYEEAAYWLARQKDDAMDWARFTSWLEADPSHRLAYDTLSLIDAQLDDYARQVAGAPHGRQADTADAAPQRRWRRWAGVGGAAAAAAVVLVIVAQPTTQRLSVRDYRSPHTATLSVKLENGTDIVLAPATQLVMKGNRMVLRGTAYFNVVHNPRQPLAISAGEFQVTDIGTRFSIEDAGDTVAIDVAQGSVIVTSMSLASPIALSAGHGLRADDSTHTLHLVNIDPGQVASWRTGKLQFDGVPLALVARDISLYSGEQVTVDPAIAEQPFSGVITISHGEAPARTVAQILSLDVKNVDGTLRLEPRRS